MSTSREVRSLVPADVATAYALLTGEAWVALLAEHLRDGSRLVRRETPPGGGAVLEVSRQLPDGVPGFLERFLPADGRATQVDTWEPDAGGVRRGTWQALIPGAPAKVGGGTRLEPAPGGCAWVVDVEVTVKVPVFGGRAERFLADTVCALVEKEAQVLATGV